jgi:hypothetical protein
MTDRVLCDNWACPAGISCALHFGRSAAYAAMREGTRLRARVVPHGKDACAEYLFDKPREWLLPMARQHTPGGDYAP